MTQKQAVINYMQDFGSISPFQAFTDLGITKLATVVSSIIRDGEVKIDKFPFTVINRYGRPVTYMQYAIKKELNENHTDKIQWHLAVEKEDTDD